MKIRLDNFEMYHFGLVGYRRNLESICKNRKPRFPESVPGELFGFHIFSAMAEGAVAKALGMYYGLHAQKFSGGDVGFFEVRWSMRSDLKVRPRDNGVVICVTGLPPELEIVGWIGANEAKRDEWKKDFGKEGKPAYFVPHKQLLPLEDLPRGEIQQG